MTPEQFNRIKLCAAWFVTLAPLVVLVIVVNVTSYQFGYAIGRSSVHRATVVRSGSPYYRGNYYGECAWSGEPWNSRQFCATEETEEER